MEVMFTLPSIVLCSTHYHLDISKSIRATYKFFNFNTTLAATVQKIVQSITGAL